jgi:LmbE family N-acetylglucosaminyl deacetylase
LKLIGQDPTKFGRNQDINLEVLVEDEDYPPHVQVKYSSVLDLKLQAEACHASQLNFGNQSPWLFRVFRRLVGGKDNFMRAFPPASKHFRTKDLFAE